MHACALDRSILAAALALFAACAAGRLLGRAHDRASCRPSVGGLPAGTPARPATAVPISGRARHAAAARDRALTDEQQLKLEKDSTRRATSRKRRDGRPPKSAGRSRKKEAAQTGQKRPATDAGRAQDWRQDQPVIKACRGYACRLERAGRLKGLRPMEEFYRIRRLPPYVFEEVNRAKARARNAGADIIDLGMGNPDLPAPAHVIEKMKETLGKPRTDRYSASRGIAGLRRAQAAYYDAPLRREAQSRHAGRRHARLQGRLRQRRAGDHRAGRRRAGAQSELSDPRLRLPDGGRRHPLGAVGADAEFLPHARARDHPFDPEADRGGGLLSGQSDRLCGEPRLLQGPRRLREEARHPRAVRSRLRGGLFRRQSAAVAAAGAGRDRHRGRVHLDVEDLFDAGLAHRLCGRQ